TYMVNDSTEAMVYKNYKNSYDLTGSIKLGKNKKGKLGVNVAYHQYRYKELKADKVTRNKYFLTYLYGQYDIKDIASIGARIGYLYNPDAAAAYVAGPAKHFFDFTLTSQINVVGGLKFIPEYRIDFGSNNVFLDRKGNGSKIQNTLSLAAVYTF
ncbi:MAG TPA: outer membrane beta-barrel protein, partial [Chitinophagales bacterium]|nr:outer membrane beta-barrel protein [Chitinophagales bacterium]